MTLEEAKQILRDCKFPKSKKEVDDFKKALNLVAGSFTLPPQGE